MHAHTHKTDGRNKTKAQMERKHGRTLKKTGVNKQLKKSHVQRIMDTDCFHSNESLKTGMPKREMWTIVSFNIFFGTFLKFFMYI